VLAANAAVWRRRDRPRLTGMGTTLTLAVFAGPGEMATYGDSRAYRYREGKLEQLTETTRLVAEMVASGELRRRRWPPTPSAASSPRALGLESAVAVDLCSAALLPATGSALLRRPHHHARHPQIAALLAGGTARRRRRLVEAANRAGGFDNTSVVVVDVRS